MTKLFAALIAGVFAVSAFAADDKAAAPAADAKAAPAADAKPMMKKHHHKGHGKKKAAAPAADAAPKQ